MTKVIGVRFRQAGKIYFFAPGKYEDIETGQHVIVETARGVEYGHVVLGIREVEDKKVIQPLKAVIRIATPEDDEREARNRRKEKEAFQICLEKIAKHKLEMKLIKVEYTFDNNKVLFYLTADGRIDFRELVKDLASVFKTRIELRQIGVRDEAKIMGGIGVCGRPLCCATYMPEFVPVSIKNEAIVERRSQAAGEEKFRVLGAYVNRKMKHMGREILDGNIAASPYKNGQKTACDYCPYHSVCGFDLKTDGYQFRRFDKLSPEEIWGKMEEKDKKTER